MKLPKRILDMPVDEAVKKKSVLRELRRFFRATRSSRSRKLDLKYAGRVPRKVGTWARRPNKYDIPGVDMGEKKRRTSKKKHPLIGKTGTWLELKSMIGHSMGLRYWGAKKQGDKWICTFGALGGASRKIVLKEIGKTVEEEWVCARCGRPLQWDADEAWCPKHGYGVPVKKKKQERPVFKIISIE